MAVDEAYIMESQKNHGNEFLFCGEGMRYVQDWDL